jgi:hypothetical protein
MITMMMRKSLRFEDVRRGGKERQSSKEKDQKVRTVFSMNGGFDEPHECANKPYDERRIEYASAGDIGRSVDAAMHSLEWKGSTLFVIPELKL